MERTLRDLIRRALDLRAKTDAAHLPFLSRVILGDLNHISLRYVDLSGLDLRGFDFTGANLTAADLSNTDLRGAIGLDLDQRADFKKRGAIVD